MSWDYQKARRRIACAMELLPNILVERFADEYLPRMGRSLPLNERPAAKVEIRDLKPGQAVVVDTVQIYVNVVNYDEMRLDSGQETEASHARALTFLHLHYSALDKASDAVDAQRVDFHGPRMHSVIVEPAGENNAAMRSAVGRALRLAQRTILIAQAAARDITRSQIKPQFRIGIDVGRCVAIDSGRDDEREPLFIGGAANYAAKLAEGNAPGIYVSDRVRALFALQTRGGLQNERAYAMLEPDLAALGGTFSDLQAVATDVEAIRENIRHHRDATVGLEGFIFHHHTPPLSTIEYSKLRPANSIRMPMVSIFADLDGYTAYVDRAVRNNAVKDAVRDLLVMRAEFNAVLQDDFGGRKVRFIGDCIHGLLAKGSAADVDKTDSVEAATACAGALRSSFLLCKELLPTAGSLGLAIGYELGSTPVSRIGIRGERSVRVASSVATLQSEECQSVCGGTQTMIGDRAYASASPDTRRLFDSRRVSTNMDFDAVVLQSAPAKAAIGAVVEDVADNRSHNG